MEAAPDCGADRLELGSVWFEQNFRARTDARGLPSRIPNIDSIGFYQFGAQDFTRTTPAQLADQRSGSRRAQCVSLRDPFGR